MLLRQKSYNVKREIELQIRKAKEKSWINQLEIPLYYNSFQKILDESEIKYWQKEMQNFEELQGFGTIERINFVNKEKIYL